MNCWSLPFLIFIVLVALGVGAVIGHELLTRWRYRQALRTLIEGETVIHWPRASPPERNTRPPINP
jgi:hypothetical protein